MSEIELSFRKLNENIVTYFQNNDESSMMREAKELFSIFINSTRKLERITNIQQLLIALKRKGLYDVHERTALRIFKKIIIDDNFADMVEKHNEILNTRSHVEEPLRNIYAERRINDEMQQEQQSHPSTTSSTRANNSKRNQVLVLISNELSLGSFRQLARVLGFLESEIMELEAKERLQSTRNMLLLSKYEERERGIDVNKLLRVFEFLNLNSLASNVRDILRK